MRRFLLALLVVLTAAATALTPPAAAQDYVEDVGNFPLHFVNTLQNYTTMVEHIVSVEQRAQQIYQYYRQIDNYYRQLKNWKQNGTWQTLSALYGDVDTLLREANTLGYRAPNLQALVAETFPNLPLPPEQWLAAYHLRLQRTLTTNKNVMKVLYSVGAMNHDTQLLLRSAQAKSQDSDGQVQAVQGNTMVLSLGAEEAGRATQAILARANANAVRIANDFQDEINDQQLLEAWLNLPPLPTDDTPSFTGVPSGWAW